MVQVRELGHEDRIAWEKLWAGYQTFYRAQIPADVTELTWRRFHDPHEPVHALGAFLDGELMGIVHFLFHRSCWTAGPYCYLQDLFTDPKARRQGVARSLIEAVYDAARNSGASQVYWLTHETNAEARKLYDAVAELTGFVKYKKGLT